MDRSMNDVRQDQLVGLMTRSLPGILRLNGDAPCQTDDVSVSSASQSRPDRTRRTRFERPLVELADAGNESRSKVKKKVTFKAEEHLEIVMEISPRLESPLLEELEPCDPEKLLLQDGSGGGGGGAQNPQSEQYGTGSCFPNNVNSGTSGKKAADVVSRIGGIMGFGLPIPVAPPVITMRKGRLGLADRRAKLTDRTDKIQTSNTHKRIRSAPPLKALSAGKDSFLGYESPMEQRFIKHGSAKSGTTYSKSAASRGGAPTGHVCRGSHARSRSPSTKRELLTASLHVTRSRTAQQQETTRIRNDPLYGVTGHPRHQIHQSPYRQGSASSGSRRSTSKSDASSLSVTGSRMDAHNKSERRVMSAPAVSPRKIHAWHEANMALRSNGLLVSEPSIAQLWDTPRSNGDQQS